MEKFLFHLSLTHRITTQSILIRFLSDNVILFFQNNHNAINLFLEYHFFRKRLTFTTLCVFSQNEILNEKEYYSFFFSLFYATCNQHSIFNESINEDLLYPTVARYYHIMRTVLRRLIQIELTRIQDLLSSRIDGHMQLQISEITLLHAFTTLND